MPYEISNTFHFIFEDQSIDLCDFFVIGTVPDCAGLGSAMYQNIEV